MHFAEWVLNNNVFVVKIVEECLYPYIFMVSGLWCACIVAMKVLSVGLCLPDVVAGDNEIEQHRNFSETHFPGVAPCRFRLVGHDGGAVWDCRPNVCCPAEGAVKWQLGE